MTNTAHNASANPYAIARLNDEFRQQIHRPQGHNRVVLTAGIDALIGDVREWPAYRRQCQLLRLVMDFDQFTPDNDPNVEHDFGQVTWNGETCFWKIDYFDLALEGLSENPANPAITARVLTIMLAEEY